MIVFMIAIGVVGILAAADAGKPPMSVPIHV
jgi:hypothetical protein